MEIESRINYLGLISTIVFIIISLAVKFILRPQEECEKPTIYFHEDGKLNKEVIKNCKKLNEIYTPTTIWGKNGHFQTIFHAILGRFGEKVFSKGKLYTLCGTDGATVTYTLYNGKDRKDSQEVKKNNLVLIVPGIANSSKTIYIQAVTSLLLQEGFIVAVYNHLGAHPKIKITSPRLFTYGCTDDLNIVVRDLLRKFPQKKLIGLGFSLGANVLLKYLGEQPLRQENFLFALSICQGYDCQRGMYFMRDWKGLRRLYSWGISRNVKKLITGKHRESFIDFERKGRSAKMDWRKISSSSSLEELDLAINKHFASFDDLNEFYIWGSSAQYMDMIKIPTFLLNALDDPLIPEPLLEAPKKLVQGNKEAVFIVMKHGGHLGFFEGGLIWPNKTTWLDHALVEYILGMEDAFHSPSVNHNIAGTAIGESKKCFSI